MKRLLTLALASALTACGSVEQIDSNDVNPDVIYGDYSATYTAESHQLDYWAQLRVGGPTGTTVRLVNPAGIKAGTSSMALRDSGWAVNNISGSYYEKQLVVDQPPSDATFEVTRSDGKVFSNSIPFPHAVEITKPAKGSAIHTNEGLTISLESQPLDPDEEIVITLHSLERPPQESKENNESQTTKSIETLSKVLKAGDSPNFTSYEMEFFRKGRATLHLSNSRSQKAVAGHPERGGQLRATYEAPTIPVIVD